tara:strand:+ start:1073 stop:1339 length:267 start_codon:yes stop_codon:yes gene_type:complete
MIVLHLLFRKIRLITYFIFQVVLSNSPQNKAAYMAKEEGKSCRGGLWRKKEEERKDERHIWNIEEHSAHSSCYSSFLCHHHISALKRG